MWATPRDGLRMTCKSANTAFRLFLMFGTLSSMRNPSKRHAEPPAGTPTGGVLVARMAHASSLPSRLAANCPRGRSTAWPPQSAPFSAAIQHIHEVRCIGVSLAPHLRQLFAVAPDVGFPLFADAGPWRNVHRCLRISPEDDPRKLLTLKSGPSGISDASPDPYSGIIGGRNAVASCRARLSPGARRRPAQLLLRTYG